MIRESDRTQPSPPCATAHAKGGDGRGDGAVFTGGAWSKVPHQLEVLGKVNGFAEQILLNTGASMCLTSPRLFAESSPGLEQYIEENLRPTTQRLVGCNGIDSRCRGVVMLLLQVGGHEWAEREVFVLDDCPHPLIVSWPSLVREDFHLGAKEGSCRFGTSEGVHAIERLATDKPWQRGPKTTAFADQCVQSRECKRESGSRGGLVNVDSRRGRHLKNEARKRTAKESPMEMLVIPVEKPKREGGVSETTSSRRVRWADDPTLSTEDASQASKEAVCGSVEEAGSGRSTSPPEPNGMATDTQVQSTTESQVDSACQHCSYPYSHSSRCPNVGTDIDWGALSDPERAKSAPSVIPFKGEGISGWVRMRTDGDKDFEKAEDYAAAYEEQQRATNGSNEDEAKLVQVEHDSNENGSAAASQAAAKKARAKAKAKRARKARKARAKASLEEARTETTQTPAVLATSETTPMEVVPLAAEDEMVKEETKPTTESVSSNEVRTEYEAGELQGGQEVPNTTECRETSIHKSGEAGTGELGRETPLSSPVSTPTASPEPARQVPEVPRISRRTGHQLPTSGPVNVRYESVIPPMSEANVAVTLVHDGGEEDAAQYLFEPTPLHRMKGKFWRAAACLTQRRRSGEVIVRVMNPTNMLLTMHPGAPLGTWEHLSAQQVFSVTALEDGEPVPGRVASVSQKRRQGEDESRESEDKTDDGITPDDENGIYATDLELQEKVNGSGHLTKPERTRLLALLRRFKFMFRKKPGRTDMVQHVIDTGDSRPIRGGRYRQSEKERETIREIVKDMTEMGVVRPSKSPWGASVVLVPKKDGSTRFCVDYRRLNEVTLKDVYPLPRIDATLDQLGGCRYFTAMDLTSGYWQVDMKDEDAAKTAFITPDGLYEFTAMPFGLCNAPATFQRLMDQVLGNLRYEYALVYLDDVMVHSKTFDEHLVHLEAVLTCLQKANLACKLKKCSFAQESTVYLGHVVSGKGIEPEPSKLEAVKLFAPPKSVKEIRMFLGFVGYYRRFINNFSAKAKPLNELLRKTVDWHWGVEQQDSFETLRDALITAPILQMPDFTKKFTIRTDASYIGLGACLLQGEGDERMPIAYASRSLKPAETRYTATEIECLGMKWAVNQFRPYVHGRRFTLETDHVALKWLRTVQHNNARLIRTAMELQQYEMDIVHRAGLKMYDADALSRLRRVREEETSDEVTKVIATVTDQACYFGEGDKTPTTEAYDEPEGACEITATLLEDERRRATEVGSMEPIRVIREEARRERSEALLSGHALAPPVCMVKAVADIRQKIRQTVGTRLPSMFPVIGQENEEGEVDVNEALRTRIKEETKKDGYYGKLFQQLSTKDLDEGELTTRIRGDLNKFVVREGMLYRLEQLYRGGRAQGGSVRYLLWIPEVLRADVLFACHDHLLSGGHLGIQKTFARLRLRYYWLGMFQSVEDWCKSCPVCATRRDPTGVQAPLSMLPVPREPFEMVSVDVLGPFVSATGSGNKYVLVYCDHLTRWVETVAFRRNDSAVMARVLVERIMCRHGAPRVLLSDRGRPFMSALAREVYRLLRVKKVSTAAYKPQTNGLVERFNRTLAEMLSKYVNSKHTDWDRYLPYVTFAYNTTVHTSTKYSPFYLLYGRDARLPVDTMLLPEGPHEHQSVEEYRAELVEGLRVAHEYSRAALERAKQAAELRRGKGQRVPVFEEGEEVMVKNPAIQNAVGLTRKLTNPWSGPFKVLRKMDEGTYWVTGVTGQGRSVGIARLKKLCDYEHTEADETDYADHLDSAGQPEPGEGNLTYAPTLTEAALPTGDGEPITVADGVPVVDNAGGAEAAAVSPDTDAVEAAPPPKTRGRPKRVPPTRTSVLRRAEPGPQLGMTTLDPTGGMRNLCNLCHKSKRNHKCTGRYIPVRQLAVARRRLGIAEAGSAPIFGIVDTSDEGAEVFGVYASNDVRKMNVLTPPESWETVCEKLGEDGTHIWAEECFKCEGRGLVLGCYGCNLAFHPRCSVRPVLGRRLRGHEEFMCPDCLRDCVDTSAPEAVVTDGGVVNMVALVSSAPVVTVQPKWRSSWGSRFPGAKPHGWLASIKEDEPTARRR